MIDWEKLRYDLSREIHASLDAVRISQEEIHYGRVVRVSKGWGFIHAEPKDVFFELKDMHIPEISSGVVTFRKATAKEHKRVPPVGKFLCYVLGADRGRGPRCDFWYLQSDFDKATRQSPLVHR